MKVMCISDIHGNIECLKKAIEKYKEENAEKLIVLGDFSSYYHSSSDYEVAEILNDMAGSITAVKGNCDSMQIDEIFKFGLTYVKNIIINDIKVTLTHGHIYDKNNLPENCGEILLLGHTHIGNLENLGDRIIANPGSISNPRGGSKNSYIIIDKNNIELKTLNGDILKTLNIKP